MQATRVRVPTGSDPGATWGSAEERTHGEENRCYVGTTSHRTVDIDSKQVEIADSRQGNTSLNVEDNAIDGSRSICASICTMNLQC